MLFLCEKSKICFDFDWSHSSCWALPGVFFPVGVFLKLECYGNPCWSKTSYGIAIFFSIILIILGIFVIYGCVILFLKSFLDPKYSTDAFVAALFTYSLISSIVRVFLVFLPWKNNCRFKPIFGTGPVAMMIYSIFRYLPSISV